MPPLYDARGNLIPLGKVTRTITEPFMTGTLQGWLTATSGTGTYNRPAAPSGSVPPGYSVASGTTPGNQAVLTSSITPASANLKAIFWTVQGLAFDSTTYNGNCTFTMALFSGTPAGGWFGQNAGDAQAAITANGATRLKTLIGYDFFSSESESSAQRNLTLGFIPANQEMWVQEDDQTVSWQRIPFANWANGVLTPNITLQTTDSNSHSFSVGQVSLTIVHD